MQTTLNEVWSMWFYILSAGLFLGSVNRLGSSLERSFMRALQYFPFSSILIRTWIFYDLYNARWNSVRFTPDPCWLLEKPWRCPSSGMPWFCSSLTRYLYIHGTNRLFFCCHGRARQEKWQILHRYHSRDGCCWGALEGYHVRCVPFSFTPWFVLPLNLPLGAVQHGRVGVEVLLLVWVGYRDSNSITWRSGLKWMLYRRYIPSRRYLFLQLLLGT